MRVASLTNQAAEMQQALQKADSRNLRGFSCMSAGIVKPYADLERECEAFRSSAKTLMSDFDRVQYHVQPRENITEAMSAYIDSEDHDLIIIDASHEWRIRNLLFGSIPDIVADYANCSVLMVRRYLLEH